MTHTVIQGSVLCVLLLTGSTMARNSARRRGQKRSHALEHDYLEQENTSSLEPVHTPFPDSPRFRARLDSACDSTKTSAVIATVGGELTRAQANPIPNPNPIPIPDCLTRPYPQP